MYTRFGENDIVNRQAQELVTSTWSNNDNNMDTIYTSSIQTSLATSTSSGQFFCEVYNQRPTGADAGSSPELQFSIAYGHKAGSGSPDFTNDTGSFGLSAARVNYNQYRQLHFNDDTKFFTFGDSHSPDGIYIINIERARYKQRLTLGSLSLQLADCNASYASTTTPEGHLLHLTDDSVTNPAGAGTSNLGTYYNIVSGAAGIVLDGTTANTQVGGSGSYGHLYPEAGLIILNADAFHFNAATRSRAEITDSSVPTYTGSKNHEKIFRAISNSGHFIIDTTEEINSEFYFCRARNDQFNYTNNESFVDANKNVRFETMKLNPKTFITTIGLYNDAFELCAVAKLSQPVAKDFTKEALIRVKLDY